MNNPLSLPDTATASSVEQAQTDSWLVNLPALLRTLGAAAVLFSLYSFLMRGWSGSSDLLRYGVLLGHTGLLAMIALASAHWLKESKGPRLLLVLALVSASANFAVLGAFLYSAVASIGHSQYPSFLLWTGVDLWTAIGLIAGSLLVLVPVVRVGFRTLIRNMAGAMSSLFLMSNVILLIPVRDTMFSAVLAIGFGVLVVWLTTAICAQRFEVKTREGMTAVLLQFLPLAILLGRIVWLYDADAVVTLATALLLFVSLRQCSLLMDASSWYRRILDVISIWVSLAAGASLCFLIINMVHLDTLALMAGALLAAAMIQELSLRAGSFSGACRVVASLIAGLGGVLSVWLGDDGLVFLVAIAVGLGLMVLSYQWQARSMFTAGTLTALAGLAGLMLELVAWFDFGNWIGLAAGGVIAIVAASVLEARGGQMRQKFLVYTARYRSWDI